MTEAAHQIASNPLPPGSRRAGTVGLAAGPQVAIRRADDDGGGWAEPGEVGEIVIRGANVTGGYRTDDPRRQARRFVDGWFRTGDQGRLDAEGYLTITGRLKEIINRGGEKISPREVDEVLLDHPAVSRGGDLRRARPPAGRGGGGRGGAGGRGHAHRARPAPLRGGPAGRPQGAPARRGGGPPAQRTDRQAGAGRPGRAAGARRSGRARPPRHPTGPTAPPAPTGRRPRPRCRRSWPSAGPRSWTWPWPRIRTSTSWTWAVTRWPRPGCWPPCPEQLDLEVSMLDLFDRPTVAAQARLVEDLLRAEPEP